MKSNAAEMPTYARGIANTIQMDGESLKIDEVVRLLNTNERLLADRQGVLDIIPECPVHGVCIPYAVDWIRERLK